MTCQKFQTYDVSHRFPKHCRGSGGGDGSTSDGVMVLASQAKHIGPPPRHILILYALKVPGRIILGKTSQTTKFTHEKDI